MENFLLGWVLLAVGITACIGWFNGWSKRQGGKTFIFFSDSIWPQGKYFLGLFFIVPFAMLYFFF